jgi:hypothetical protein
MSSVIHIAPQLPPAVDGVGDYCWNLWRHWPGESPEWKFAVRRGAEETSRAWPQVEVEQFNADQESLATILERSGCSTAVLHYVGYGFQPKGIPTWMPGAIAHWKKADPTRRLVTMFHEMYAHSSPLRSPFWVAPIARRIIRELVKLSDSWITSCERYFKQLTIEFSARADLGHVLPIGSNIPVAEDPLQRDGATAGHGFRVVVFGLPRTRLWALERHCSLLRTLTDAGALDSITLLGKPNATLDEGAWQKLKSHIGPIPRWHLRFDLSTGQISRELIRHDLGLLPNEIDTLTKSGVFAAFAAHGVLPVLSPSNGTVIPSELHRIVITSNGLGHAPDLLQMRDDPAAWANRRERLLAFAARELSWRRIAGNWKSLLETRGLEFQAGVATPPRHQSPSCPVRQPLLSQP